MSSIGHRPRTWAVIPLRGLHTAKTRLAPALDAEERLALVIEMATRTLVAARDARGVAGTVLVTADPAAADLALGLGARTLVQVLPGLNAALREGRAEAIRAGATAVIVIPIDLPAISASMIDGLLDAIEVADGRPAAVVAVVPDRHHLGTNILYTAPPAAIDPAFGDGSLAAHRDAAHAAGATFLELGGPLVLDVDTGDDLLVAEADAANRRPAAARANLDDGHAA